MSYKCKYELFKQVEYCKNCICNTCKHRLTVNYELPDNYCENCDYCDLGDFAKNKCSGYLNENVKTTNVKTTFVMPEEIKKVDGPYRTDIIRMFKEGRFRKLDEFI